MQAGVAQAIDELDLGALGRALWRKKGRIIILTLMAVAIAFAAVNMITPRYRSEARVLIETRENIFLRPDAEKSTERGTTVDQEAMTSQVQLILSRDLARDVIKKLKLNERPEFDPVLRGTSLIQVLLVHMGIIKDPMSQTPEERVLKSFYDRLTVFSVDKSRVIAIEFESEDPELAAQVANAMAEGYLVLQQNAKQDQSRSAGVWLGGEIAKLRDSVAAAESKVEQYRSKTNLFVGTNNTSLSNQQLGDFNAQVSAARVQKADAEARARIIREALRSGAPVEFSDIVNSELMRRLSEQRVTLQAQLAEQSSTLLDQHPRIKELRAQIADLERQLRVEADRLARSLENDAKMADARVSSLSSSFDQLKRQAANTNEEDVQLRALEREAKSQRDLLESYLAKFREASARDNIGAASPEARIISTAAVSTTPAYPKKLATVLVAALGMFVLSVGFVLSGELLGAASAPPRARFAPAADLGPVIAAVEPEEMLAPQPTAAAAIMTHAPAAALAPSPVSPARELRVPSGTPLEAIESLARELGQAGASGRRITVLGARRHAGIMQTAISLARSLAKRGTVALVDLSFGSSNLTAIAGDPGAPGISELVAGSSSFGQIITRDRYSRVHLVTAGRAPVDGQTILSSLRLSITLEALARSYDHVVVDAGALRDATLDRFAQLAPRAVLIADGLDDPATASARDRLIAAGFVDVRVLASGPRGPEADVTGDRAAA
jgi:polysaccharide biosynthesis transport protein